MLLIERAMAAVAQFIACDVFRLDSRDIERVRAEQYPPVRPRSDDRQIIVRFGR